MPTLTVIDPISLFNTFEFFGSPQQRGFEMFEILQDPRSTITPVSQTEFTATLGNRTVIVTGTGFDADAGGIGTTGTIDGMVMVQDGQQTYAWSDLGLDIATFNALVAQEGAGTVDAIETFLFTQALTIIGHEGTDSHVFGSARSADGISLNTNGDDRVILGDGNDVFNGASGNDTIIGQAGNDGLEGSDGRDRLQGGKGNDDVRGGDQKDLMLGGRGDDTLDGGTGADIMRGGPGNDTLDGGRGRDVMEGGDGADTFQFFGTEFTIDFGNADRITDYNPDEDILLFFVEDMDTVTLSIGGSGNVRVDYDNGSVVLDGITDVADVTVTQGNFDDFT